MNLTQALTYDDVLLEPQYSNIKSRQEIHLSNSLDHKRQLELPIISSPMDTVTEIAMAIELGKQGGLGIIHRFNTIEKQYEMVRIVHETLCTTVKNSLVAAAIGVNEDFLERAISLVYNGASILCIDIAHGHHILMERALKTLKDKFVNDVHIMAGNVATTKGYLDLSKWGADSIRCNIGGGSICSTRIQTGHGKPGLQTILDCVKEKTSTKIIADGGIRSSGDIIKALAAGADFVMLGSLLAGTEESPGDKIITSGGTKKRYRGMASKEAQIDWKGSYASNEGIEILIPYKGRVKDILLDLKKGIISGLSYSGAKTIAELQQKAKFIQQTNAGLNESATHIKQRL